MGGLFVAYFPRLPLVDLCTHICSTFLKLQNEKPDFFFAILSNIEEVQHCTGRQLN